ncbi:MAG: glucoamylase family protein [Eubacteriales bacterium]|nr:glucoamylase family protein [Eubacteriales bacterium]
MLYNPKKSLFSLGFEVGESGRQSEICYDLYMSEARTTSYYALAKGIVPKKHWAKLSRTLISGGGYIGMASWTGTTFEYFMPPLFLPVYDNSFEYEALRFAFEQQRKKHIAAGLSDGVWGLSESAFFSFDSEMNYQYKAVGVQKLGLKRYLTDEPVVSPYSSFLMLKISPESCVNNLKKLEEYGMIGEHGHYEACDFTPTRAGGSGFAVIKSYMSHHLGMSITAAANACFAEVFVRRFIRNPSMAAAYELLQEKVPDVSIYHDIAPEAKPAPVPPHTRSEGSIFSYSIQNPELRLVNSGRLTMLVGDLGHVSMRFGKVIINECDFDLFNAKSGFSLKLSGKAFVPTSGKEDESASFTVEHKDGAVSHIRTSGEFSGRARFSTEGKCIRIETLAGEKANCFAELEFPIALDDEQTFKAHPAFSKLSVSAEFIEGEKIILYSRKPKLKARPLFLAVALADEGVGFSFDTRLTDVRELVKPLMGRTGASVNPYLRIKTQELSGGRACFLISCAATKEEALSAIRSGRAKYKENGKKQGIYRHLQPAALSRVLGAIYFSSPVLSQAERVSGDIHSLWRYSISGDYPILLADTNDDSSVYESLILFRTLTIASVRCELVVVVREADRYARESRRSVMKAVSLAHCEAFLGRRGGVFVIDYEDFRIDESRNDYNYLLANSIDLLSLTEEGRSGGIIPEVVTQIENRENKFGEGIIKVEGGSFDENGGFIIDKSSGIPLEWSYITANHCLGSVQTQNSLGFSYFRNAQKNKLTEFSNNPYFPNRGERILMFVGGKAYDLCAVSSFVRFGEGKVIWQGSAGGIDYEMSLFVCEKFPVKLIKLSHSGGDGIVTALVLRPDGGRLAEITKLNQGVVCFRNLRKSKVYGFAGTVPSKIEAEGFNTEHSANSGVVTDFSSLFGEETLRRDCAAVYTKSSEVWFYVGAAPQQKTAEIISGMIDRSFAEEQEKAAAIFYKSLMPKPKEKLEAPFAVMYNHFMPYQVTISRFFSRCAYYQVGGAYGYRDQLQDSLMLMKTRPDLVRTHIVRCSAHQYEDGGVQHWWHPLREGVRTRCSDDFLWLPLVTAEYLRETGDGSVLDVKTRWLVSPELREGESERYEHAGLSEGKDSVYEHCVRALQRSLSFGKHGLPLMGSCDWNDGFSELGEEGRGESVFTAWLFIWAVREFGTQMIERGDERAEGLQKAANSVLGAIESYCFDGDRYLRAFTDNGEALGAFGSGEAELDILPQCMPAIVGGADEGRVSIALDMAYSMCFDRKWQIMKLFTPPFDKDTRKIGYIQSYVPGIRENGGQYTHASMWMALGLWRAGKKDKAIEAARALNPVIRCADKRLAEAYKIEPFVLSGDIYSNPKHPGRGGWSWYTGSAAWFWRLIDEIWE